MNATRQFAERNQMSIQIADLKLVRFAHIENKKIVAPVQTRFQFARSDFRNLHIWCWRFFAANAAEFVIVDQLGKRRVLPANRAIGILAQFQFAEFHSERIKEQQTAYKIVSTADDELDRFHRLNRAHNARQYTEYTAFRA